VTFGLPPQVFAGASRADRPEPGLQGVIDEDERERLD